MKLKIIDYNTALKLKEIGFILTKENEPIFEIYTKDGTLEFDSDGFISNCTGIIYAPTQAITQQWLREVHNIHIVVWNTLDYNNYEEHYYPVINYDLLERTDYNLRPKRLFETYEHALEAGILETVHIIKTKQNG